MTRELHELILEAHRRSRRLGIAQRDIQDGTGLGQSLIGKWISIELRPEEAYKNASSDAGHTQSLRSYLGMETESEDEGVTIERGGNGLRISGTISGQVMKYEEVFQRFGLDPDEWTVKKLICKPHTQGGFREWTERSEDGTVSKKREPHITQLYSLRVDLEPRLEAQAKIKAVDAMLKRMEATTIIVKHEPRIDTGEPHLLVFNMQDVHIGKRAADEGWGVTESLAEHTRAVEQIIDYIPRVNVQRGLYYLGADLGHIDNVQGQTTSGTQVESDGSYENIFDAGCTLTTNTLARIAEVADEVHAGLVNGNHDWNMDYGVARVVDAYFRHDPRIQVVIGQNGLLPYEYGQNFLLGVHGNNTKPDLSAMSLALSFREAWGRTRYREVHQGHVHRKHGGKFYSAYTEEHGVTVRTCGSLSPTDNWHQLKTFLGGLRTAEAYLYGMETGHRCTINYNVAGEPERNWGWVGKAA